MYRKRARSVSSEDEHLGDKIMLSYDRFADVSNWRGTVYISIREYYTDKSNVQRPSKKGISLRMNEWEKL